MSSRNYHEAKPASSQPGAPARRWTRKDRLFKLEFESPVGFRKQLVSRTSPITEKIFGIDRLNDIYARVADQTKHDFLTSVLEELHIACRITDEDRARIPKTGPVVVVSNHPFGAIDGVILSWILGSVRPDVKVMANYLLNRIPNLRDLFIFVDPFGGEGAVQSNMGPMRQSLRWLKDGGMLAAFPAGEVAHLNLKEGQITDPKWNSTISRIIRRSNVPVLPVFFNGHNSKLFQLLGLVHPRLRTAMLPREILNKNGQKIEVRIGSLISAAKTQSFSDDEEFLTYLRRRTFLLRHRTPANAQPRRAGLFGSWKAQPPLRAVVPPIAGDLLLREVEALPPGRVLIEHDDMRVVYGSANQVPHCLAEIGRLREITFRATGEGTGNASDLDSFDSDYLHLFIWDQKQRRIVGAYRLGQTDKLLAARGRQGLYTSTLFDYPADLLQRLGPSLEMGRSFIRQEYQKSFAPLLLLWKGIGHYVVANPQYRTLLGPVSISARYHSLSRQMMVQFLKMHHMLLPYMNMVRPRNPFRPVAKRGVDRASITALLQDGDDLSDLIADLEPDHKGIPVLLRQYLNLGAKLLSFNLDSEFSDVLDGLIVVDLTQTPRKLLDRYLGKQGTIDFLTYHGKLPAPAAVAPVLV